MSIIQLVVSWTSFYQFCITILVYLIIKLILHIRTRIRRYKLFTYYGIPGPKPGIISGNLCDYKDRRKVFETDVEFRAKYGKIYATFIVDNPTLTSTDLELLKGVFLNNPDSFKDRMYLPVETPINESLLFAKYAKWKSLRKLISPTFSGYKLHGSESMEFVEESIRLMLEYIEKKFDSDLKCAKIQLDFYSLMKATTLRLISQMAINLPDVKVQENDDKVRALDDILTSLDNVLVIMAIRFPFLRPLLDFFSRHFEFCAIIKLIDRSLNETIDQELIQTSTPSKSTPLVMESLINLHRDGKLTREEVIANSLALLMAGYDTTSTTLVYIFWVISKHPDVQKKLRQELVTYGSESQYLDQVIDETMRLYPTVVSFASRVATKTVKVCDIVIPQSTRVVYNAWLVHRDADIWPEPLEFKPERFAPGVEHHSCAFAPFGLGDRKCLGLQLAKLELKMITCEILLRYKVDLLSPVDLDLLSSANVLTKPKDKVVLELSRL